jgi:hypothetical protein
MKSILIRLFIIFPLYLIWFGVSLTLIIPLLYWVLTGYDYIDIPETFPDYE